MKPESAAFLDKARDLLERASALLAQQFTDEAGRNAYFAGFHAAQAFIFEKTDRSPKTHSGVQAEFARLAKREPLIDDKGLTRNNRFNEVSFL
ncbi:MAG: HEPN domain-containing protein, partial [Rhodoplanes sp.]